jgi:hypothetical protein
MVFVVGTPVAAYPLVVGACGVTSTTLDAETPVQVSVKTPLVGDPPVIVRPTLLDTTPAAETLAKDFGKSPASVEEAWAAEAVAALPEQAAAVVAVAALPEQAAAVVAVAALPEQAAAVVAEEALPESAAVMVPAEKLPDASLSTIVEAVLAVAGAPARASFETDPVGRVTVPVAVRFVPERSPVVVIFPLASIVPFGNVVIPVRVGAVKVLFVRVCVPVKVTKVGIWVPSR